MYKVKKASSETMVTREVLITPADPLAEPPGRVAGLSCSLGCRVQDSAEEAADTHSHAPVLQPGYTCKKIKWNRLCEVLFLQNLVVRRPTLCSGDAPSSSQIIGSALCCSKSSTTSKWPQYAERCSGVAPPGVWGDAQAPFSRRNLHTARWPLRLA